MLKLISKITSLIRQEKTPQLEPYESLPRFNKTGIPPEVVTEGNPLHCHQFSRESWNKELLGPNFEGLDNYYAKYKALYKCSCGREIVLSNVAFI